jgi:hypothetical protein
MWRGALGRSLGPEVSAMSSMLELPPVHETDTLREEAIARLKRKRRFVESAGLYVAVNGVLWVIWALSDRSTDGGVPWPVWVSAIWGFFLALDAWRAYGPWPRGLRRPITDEDIEREVQRFHGE